MQKKTTIIHPGTQHSPHLAKQLNKLGLLNYYITSIAFANNTILANGINSIPFLKRKLSKRIINNFPQNKLKTIPFPELKFLFKQQVGSNFNVTKAINQRNSLLQESIKDIYIEESDIIIGYDTSSWIIAQKAKNKGKKFILDQSTCHSNTKEKYNEILYNKYPKWFPKKVEKKNKEFLFQEKIEHELADLIIVPSTFVKDSLIENGVEDKKIIINHYGTDNQTFGDLGTRDFTKNSIIFLFVGTINANKGIPDLIKSWLDLNLEYAELWIVGYGKIPDYNTAFPSSIKFLGKLDKLSLAKIYNEAHVFVFPSYFEGLAQVQIEALSCGLPVIGTFNSGATEIIQPEENGHILQAGNTDELKKSIIWFSENRSQIKTMSINAKRASTALNWDTYGIRWQNIINSI